MIVIVMVMVIICAESCCACAVAGIDLSRFITIIIDIIIIISSLFFPSMVAATAINKVMIDH